MMNSYKPVLFLLFLCAVCLPSFSQHVKLSFTISSASDVQVPNATIILNQQKYKADSLGNATIETAPCYYTINVSSVNYYPYTTNYNFTRDTSIHIIMHLIFLFCILQIFF